MSEIISEGQRQEWRKMYHSKRYLLSLSLNDLEKRLYQILGNLLTFSKDGIPLLDDTKKMDGFVERLIHIEEEMALRNISIDLDSKINKYSEMYPNIVRAMSIQISRKLITGEYLAIFGLKEYFEQTINTGRIQIKPASEYNKIDFNEAVKDDELSQTLILPKNTKLKRKMETGQFEEITGIQSISITNTYPTDFYIYCMSTTYQPRLFDDFKADSCMLIYDVSEFLKKFNYYLKKYHNDWMLESSNVKYFDPFFPSNLLTIPFNKHFSYWYQSEFRIAFKPKTPVIKLNIIYPELGSLNNCCELILL